ncbi:hypothetical protein [Roseicitreum antarcticum]|uniref:hypothetical protein n=1 Tax=Roseicitreum antarcticum TaxID=564137 RepID=UPI001681AFE2|nr:hypothetical protein [Roseicitreum antarcticum]
MSFLPSQNVFLTDCTQPLDVSSGSFSDLLAGKFSRRLFDPHRARREFPEEWAAYCRENWENSTELGADFGVSEKAARLWMYGTSCPSGWVVDVARDGLIPGKPAFKKSVAA